MGRCPDQAVDTSPPHIRKIRAAFCNEFIKTGNINTELQQQLKDYVAHHTGKKSNG
jgi:hypothetical protein